MGMYVFKQEDAEDFARAQGIHTFQRQNELVFEYCPYCKAKHKDDRNKFSIDLNTGRFHCFRASCNANGNMITLSKDFNFSLGADVDQYYRHVRSFRNISGHEKPETKPAAVAYMESRGISEEVTNRYNLTVQKDNEKILVFPFYDDKDQLQFVKYRKMDYDKAKGGSKEWCENDCKPILFGMNHCDPQNDTLVLTEGQIDSLSLTEAGIQNAVSVPTGANGFTWVPHCWDFMHKFKTLIVFGDYEKEHMTLLAEMAVRFDGTVKHVRTEDYRGCKDANEILQKHGKKALIDAVSNAEVVEHPQIKSLLDVQRVDLTKLEKFSSGFKWLDGMLGGFYMGQLVIITGERGEGKSTLASQFATRAVSAGYSVFCYSGELMDWFFRAWFDSQVAGPKWINSIKDKDTGYVEYNINAEVMPFMERWYGGKVYVYDKDVLADKEEYTLPQTIETAIKQYGCRVIIVDNLMTAMVDDMSQNENRQQTAFVNALAKLAKRYDALIFLIAHPKKKDGFKSGFDNDDISGTGNITNLADVVLRYARAKGKDIPADSPIRNITIHKNRLTGRISTTGRRLYFEPSSKRISEVDKDFGWEIGWENMEPEYRQLELSMLMNNDSEWEPAPKDGELPFD